MNTDELDRFFAQADDVLDNWHGSLDSMNTGRAAHGPAEFDAQAVAMADAVNAAVRQMTETLKRWWPVVSKAIEEYRLQTHAFTPDYDLACTHPACTLTPEEH